MEMFDCFVYMLIYIYLFNVYIYIYYIFKYIILYSIIYDNKIKIKILPLSSLIEDSFRIQGTLSLVMDHIYMYILYIYIYSLAAILIVAN